MTNAIRIHRHALSGHSHRVELFANLTGIAHELIDVDLAAGAHKQDTFLALNPFGQVPVVQDGDVTISDSNAILVYLARRYAPDWLGQTPEEEAAVQKFLSIAAGPIAFGPAAARLVTVFGAQLDAARAQEIAKDVFAKLDTHLEGRDFLVGGKPTIADVAIYSYTAHAPEGNVSLEAFQNVQRLLRNVEGLKGFVPMAQTKVGLAA